MGIACGVISASCLLSWAWSLTQTSVANSNLLHNLTPVFATLGGWLFFRNSFDNRFLIGLIFALGGTMIIGLGDLQVSPDNFRGDAVALLSAVFYGGSLLVREKFRDKFPVVTVLLWICGVGSIVALSVTFFTEDRLFPYSLNGWLSIIALGLICQVVGQSILTYRTHLRSLLEGIISQKCQTQAV